MRKNNKIYHGKTLAEWTAKAVRECYLQEKKDGLKARKISIARPVLHNFNKEKSPCK